ncbi:murein DD-endopeptidase MepM/ murein hydrolase activator NlpD [Paenibacillus shirakamiensis]|uniref:Murein DD-endopeptidase MepM/ murein hydrolase activator NlpD n=1 Tax=Paenibacillus shirakamiensis TaxID=1265935 RepID=A0ABS4JG57_9BACL|nr:M23 family metallopeptidase [Paenibacillus shirakamiensis]MBP2000697.1 murein DD-endopeptidase MepM/ murein hydrolase activator NlpD [Paenibacillus shirakamiensis]
MRNSSKMTLLILQDANPSVRQIQVSKPLVLAVPLVVLLSISGLLVSLQTHSGQMVSGLQQELEQTNLQLEATVTDKEEALKRIQQELTNLSSQSKSMKSKMQKVTNMEAELQKMLKKFETPTRMAKNKKTALTPSISDKPGKGGEFIAIHNINTSELAAEAKDDFADMARLFQVMEQKLPLTLEEAASVQEALSAAPSLWPTLSHSLTSNFGYRSDPFTGKGAFHAGVDISGEIGDSVFAAGAGTVVAAESSPARGNYIIIQHDSGLQSWYMHLSKLDVSVNDSVLKGTVIGELGSSGRSTGPHLHFQVVKGIEPLNPLPFLENTLD